jgi:predicted phage tail component-like protein
MTGFFFNNRHSLDFWMAMEDAHRPLLPALRRNDYEITGRHGTVDFGGETYATRQISIDLCFISDNVRNLQTAARDIAFWLSGKGLLWFDDETDKAYDAVVYEAVDTEQLIRTKRTSVVFECQPFAKTINFLQSVHSGASSGHIMDIFSDGSVPTPVIIIIKNTGAIDIENIAIRRRAITQ